MSIDLSGMNGDDLLRFTANTLLKIQGDLRIHVGAIIAAVNEVRDALEGRNLTASLSRGEEETPPSTNDRHPRPRLRSRRSRGVQLPRNQRTTR